MNQKNKTVLVTGVFDLLHQEHLNFLQKAKLLGDQLVVGIESDRRVKQMKGQARPILSQGRRRSNLEALRIADQVVILPEQFGQPADHLNFVKKVGAKILAVSSHTAFLAEKQRIMAQVGGKVVVVHQHNPAISTSILLAQKP